jgi:hypothetical protein
MFILYSRSYHIHIAQVLHRRIDQVREFLGEQDAGTRRPGQGFQPDGGLVILFHAAGVAPGRKRGVASAGLNMVMP